MTFVHKTPTHEITTPVLPANYKHPVGLTCRNCGGTFNTSFALRTHMESMGMRSTDPDVFTNSMH